ncbi:CatA-like O-acetyltransferase [Solicola gregarius]|uniref:Chloramphenicol acetyltransferase n=1 Tax=Solicola gregarius TaxID=2908642 RepID=A0AA46TNQ6_9ACTN|nr:CatA-like O-acetyltransferase [Solicola gregarius]UYM07748.1 chloramphenicol acetyltransferase [Solicola gregarius]
METARPIDLDTWPRREHFDHYRDQVPCSHAMTVDVDVTEFAAALRASTHKTYVAQIWALASLVNRHAEFRLTLTDAGEPAVWDVVHPMFTVFNPDRETFAASWVPYDADFARFHDRAVRALADHRGATSMFPQGPPPANCFDVSSIPWTAFSGFNLQIDGASEHFLPIFTLGRYTERAGRTFLPLAVQVHHAAADGFHTARLVNEFRELAADPTWVAG